MRPAICGFAFTLVSTAVLAWGSPAQEKPAAAQDAPKALPLATSTQGKEAAAVDVVLTLVHSGGGKECGGGTMPPCENTDHWQVKVKLNGKGGGERTFGLTVTKKEDLRKHLEAFAARKIRIKHADRVSISNATLSLRVGPQVPYCLVQGVVATVAGAGITQIEFAVLPGAGKAEQRLAMPLPLDEASNIVVAKDEGGVRVMMRVVNEKRDYERQVGVIKIPMGEAGDVELRTRVVKSTVEKTAPAVIVAQKSVPWQAVVGVIDICQAAGRTVIFANPDFAK
ncbi:MAG TPA: hypothetical protein VF384_01430 [Planctomycetota bacterium]